MSEKYEEILGWIATALFILMYIAYVPQIISNLSGNKGDFIQPLVAAINCTLWVIYGLSKKEKDFTLAAANAPGIIFGLIAVITALI